MKLKLIFAALILVSLFSFAVADILSINYGGDGNVVMTPEQNIEGFFSTSSTGSVVGGGGGGGGGSPIVNITKNITTTKKTTSTFSIVNFDAMKSGDILKFITDNILIILGIVGVIVFFIWRLRH